MTSKEASLLHQELKETLKEFGDKHNLEFQPFNLTYSDDGIHFTGKAFCTLDEDGRTIGVKQREFERICEAYGFKKSDYRKIFTATDGKKYRLVGFNVKARKNCLLIQFPDDYKQYMAPRYFLKTE